MSKIERVRLELYKVIESGDSKKILEISQELDELILSYMNSDINKSA